MFVVTDRRGDVLRADICSTPLEDEFGLQPSYRDGHPIPKRFIS